MFSLKGKPVVYDIAEGWTCKRETTAVENKLHCYSCHSWEGPGVAQ